MAKTRFPAAVALFGWALCIAQGAAGQEPIDGVCDDSLRNGCSAGTANDAAIPDNATTYLWRCDGQHGGTNSDKCHIRVADVVDGACDDTVRNGCSAGTPNDAAIPDNAATYLWRCDGQRGGANSDKCHILVADVVADNNCPQDCGACGCTPSGRDATDAGVCSISGGSCTVAADNCPQDCGTCACTTSDTDATNAGACSISGNFCLVAADNCPRVGACNNSVRNGCSPGTAVQSPDTDSHYQWICQGLNNGRNSGTCSKAKPATLCGPNRSCTQNAVYTFVDCPDSERGTPGHCIWLCSLDDRSETCYGP